MPPPRPYYKHLPNIITASRMAAVPIVVALMLFVWPDYPELLPESAIEQSWLKVLMVVNPHGIYNWPLSFWAGLLFAAASTTDMIDGYLARKWDVESNLGKLLDPLADKLMVIGAMIMLIPLGRLPAWMVMVVLSREISITALRGIASAEGKVMAASELGKYKTIFQMVALAALLFHYKDPYYNIDFHNAGAWLFMVALFFTLWSGVDYFYKYSKAEPVNPEAD